MAAELAFHMVLPAAAPDAPADAEVRVLAIGDPHFQMKNLDTVAVFVERTLDAVRAHAPAFVVVLGDLLHDHEKVHSTVMARAHAFIAALADLAPVYVLVGNHDMIDQHQFLTENHWMTAMKRWDPARVAVVDRGAVRATALGTCVFVPYVPPGRFVEALDAIAPAWRDAALIFCHQEIRGCKMGAVVSEVGDAWDPRFPVLIAGHIHDKQRPQPNVFYTGSSLQHAFGESTDKTLALLRLTRVRGARVALTVEPIDLGMPAKRIAYATVDEMPAFDRFPKNPDDQLRITVSGDRAAFLTYRKTKHYAALVARGIKVFHKPARRAEPEDLGATTAPERRGVEDILADLVRENNDPRVAELFRAVRTAV
jgi:DNA repair exonuclease SbcCD nuclease subunit